MVTSPPGGASKLARGSRGADKEGDDTVARTIRAVEKCMMNDCAKLI